MKVAPAVVGADATRCTFRDHTRDVIVLIAIGCLSMVIANAIALNFAVICMHATATHGPSTPMFTERQTAWLFSAVAVGALLGTWPIARLNFQYGARKTFTVYGLLSAFGTVLTPAATHYGFGAVFVMRLVVGFAFAMTLPATGIVAADWASLKRSGTYVALLSCHLQLGPILAMPMAGVLCQSAWGWPALFHVLGALTLFWFGVFFAFYGDSPMNHRNVSLKELAKIQEGKEAAAWPDGPSGPSRTRIPYAAIVRDPAVLGCLACTLGSRVGFQVFALYGPRYLHAVLGLALTHTGLLAALPALLTLGVKLAAGRLSDRLGRRRPARALRFFATLSQLGVAACCLGLAALRPHQVLWGQVLFTGVTVFNGLNALGATKAMQLIGGRFVAVLMSLSAYVNAAAVLLVPQAVGAWAPRSTPAEWARLLAAVALLALAGVALFDLLAAARPRPGYCCSRRLMCIQPQ